MHSYISNFLNPYQENNFKTLLDTLRVHGARIVEEKIKEIEKIEQMATINKVYAPTSSIKESFLEDIITIGRIGDCTVTSKATHPTGPYRFIIDTTNHTGYHPPSDIVKYVKATNIYHYGSVIHMAVLPTGVYSEYDALGYLFNSHNRELKTLFYYCDWKNFNFNAFYIKVEKFIETVFKTSQTIANNAVSSIVISEFIADFVKSGTKNQNTGHQFNINGVKLDAYYFDGVYQFTFNYKNIKSDYMRGLNQMLKDQGYHVKSTSFSPIKLLLVREPKSFNGNTPEYK